MNKITIVVIVISLVVIAIVFTYLKNKYSEKISLKMAIFSSLSVIFLELLIVVGGKLVNDKIFEPAKSEYLEMCEIVESGRYYGGDNQGDSFIYKIGKHELSKGNIDINKNEYEHGLEIWIARVHHEPELSWVYSTYDLNNQYTELKGRVVLLNGYNTTDFDTTLVFYDKEKKLKEYRLSPQTIPFDISVNVKGVDKLTIFVKDNIAATVGTDFGLVNCNLIK